MEYILVMSLSGSTMTILYLLAKYLLRDKISARMHYLLAKAAVLYYLIPMPFLKSWYKKFINAVMPGEQAESARITLRWTQYVLHSEEKRYLNIYAKFHIAVITVWLVVACLLLLRQLWEYLQTIRWFVEHTNKEMTDSQAAVVESLKKKYRVRRRVIVCQGEDGTPTITFGVFRPVILCGKDLESREAELLIRHEMAHIKRWDIFWKVLLQFVKFIHWWNPVKKFLLDDFERVSEWACDEAAMQGKSEEEVKEYILLMIEESRNIGKPKTPQLRFRAGFGDNAKRLQERMENLMSKKKWNKVVAGVLVTVLAFANSMTVFAYRDAHQEGFPAEASQEEIEYELTNDVFTFDFEGNSWEDKQALDELEILYDNQFTDEEGNIYPVTDPVQRGCSHTYKSGIETTHHPFSDGSCEVSQYDSQMCTKCGYVLRGSLRSRTYYPSCPH